MHITLETDYAIRIVTCLSTADERMEAKRIAENTGVTLRFSLKILRKLVGAGLVKSYKGIKGGYDLAKPPGEISVHDVISSVEGPFSINRCAHDGFECNRNRALVANCPYHDAFCEISQLVRDRLNQLKIG